MNSDRPINSKNDLQSLAAVDSGVAYAHRGGSLICLTDNVSLTRMNGVFWIGRMIFMRYQLTDGANLEVIPRTNSI